MKKYIAFLWPPVFFVVLVVLTSCNNGSTVNYQSGTIVCLGDSLTAGYGATTPRREDKSKSYPAYLQNKVNIPVIGAGRSGDTTARGLARVDTEVLSHNPQIVIILLGGNDFSRRIPAATIENNLQSIIDKVNDGSRMIYLAKFYSVATARAMGSRYGITDYDTQTAIMNQYDTMFNTLASKNNITLIEDIWDGVWGMHMSDPIHPNARGYEIMADNIFSVLQPYLQANDLIK